MTETDKITIAEVLVRYATGIDTRDWALFSSCFSDDVDADYGDFGRWYNVDDLTAFMINAHQDLGATLHRISNIVIKQNDIEVTSKSYVDVILMPGEEGADINQAQGVYSDVWVKGSKGWQIKQRDFTLVNATQTRVNRFR